jgi:hypothetical protein
VTTHAVAEENWTVAAFQKSLLVQLPDDEPWIVREAIVAAGVSESAQ